MKKFLRSLLITMLSLVMLISGTACFAGSSGSDEPDVLDIYLLYKGYQDEWLTANIELFKQQQWVKDKYPELEVNYNKDGVDSTASKKISAGPSINKYDLIFSVNMDGYDGTNLTLDLTDKVYLSNVPGESVRVIDKIPNERLDTFASDKAEPRDDTYIVNGEVRDNTYYTLSYIDGVFGWMVNYDALDAMDEDIPVTTEEMYALMKKVQDSGYTLNYQDKSGNPKTVTSKIPMMSTGSGYMQNVFNVWWAQYESVDEYCNYFYAFDAATGTENSREVLKQTGRLRSLEVCDELFLDYAYADANDTRYDKGQAMFLQGTGLFHYNGDYFGSEMRTTIETLIERDNIDWDIRYMKMPVISSIVEKCSFYKANKVYSELTQTEQDGYDAILSAIIKEIDQDIVYATSKENGAAKTYGISEADWNIIASARSIGAYNTGNTQTVAIPAYSPAADLACDFLRFMYTDVAIKNGAIASKGIRMAAKYDFASDQETFSQFSRILKSSYDLQQGTSNYAYTIVPQPDSFPYGRAGLVALSSIGSGKIELLFAQKTKRQSARDIYDQEIDYWTQNKWDQTLSRG